VDKYINKGIKKYAEMPYQTTTTTTTATTTNSF